MLRAVGVAFESVAADLDEDRITADLLARGTPHNKIAGLLAEAKAQAISGGRDALVLGSDQTLTFRGELLGNACSIADARETLWRLRGATHRLTSAACLCRNGRTVWNASGHADLTMRAFSADFLDRYLDAAGEEILGSVGCYHLEGLGAQLFERVEGDYFTVLGMPLLDVLAALRDQGILGN